MKYTDKQKRILTLCRKYSKVHCSFDTVKGEPVAILYIKPNWDRDDLVPYSDVETWLKKHTTLKQVGRPKGSTKPSNKIKRVLSLTIEADEQLSELAERGKSSRSAVISEIVSDKHKNLCKSCYYSGVGIYCVRNSWTEPFKDGGCEYFSKKGGNK